VDIGSYPDAPVDAGEDAVADVAVVGDAGGDAVAVADVPAMDAADAGAGDAGEDAVAVDVPDVQIVDSGPADAGSDRPDVVAVDAPRDAGPVDGGPVVYDLEATRAETSYRVVYRRISKGSGSTTDCDTPPTATSCSVAGGTLRFSLHTCSTDFTGALPLSTTAGRTVSIFAGGGGSSATTVRIEVGRRIVGSPARQSFHVQIAAPVQNNEPGVTGIPGRTVDPALGDLWLLGCPSG